VSFLDTEKKGSLGKKKEKHFRLKKNFICFPLCLWEKSNVLGSRSCASFSSSSSSSDDDDDDDDEFWVVWQFLQK
jgi:hypothetical protein